MEEIKLRTTVVKSFLSGEAKTIYKATTIESACLQLRKIMELIALGSLVANKDEFVKQNDKFKKMWNAKIILNDIERINPKFYPRPILEKPGPNPAVKREWIDVKDGFLTIKKFIFVYDKCGRILHANNPFREKMDYGYYDKSLPIWMEEIRVLLNAHTIRLINDRNIYLIHMKENQDNKVHCYTFAPTQ
jgi:hypothetical protein